MQPSAVSLSGKKRAALVAGVVTFVLAIGVLELEQRRFAERVTGGPPIATLLAARDLEPGAVLDASALTVARLPSAYLDARRVLESDRERVIGRPVGTAIRTGEALVWSDVVTAEGPTRLSLLVSPGRRAVQLPASVNTLGLLLRPRDRVDVLLGLENRVETLLENVRVIAVGNLLGAASDPVTVGSEGTRSRSSATTQAVTLDVSRAEAETLFSAERRGALRLVLRHPSDSGVVRRETGAHSSVRQPARQTVEISRKEIEHVR